MIYIRLLSVIFTTILLPDKCHARTCVSSYDERGKPVVKPSTERCHSDYQACFTRWRSINGSDTIAEQGCLNVGSHNICSVTECKERTGGTTDHFCCCYSDLCNQNFTKFKASDYDNAQKNIELWREVDKEEEKISGDNVKQRTICGYHDNSRPMPNGTEDYETEQLPGTILRDSDAVICQGNDFCFTVWQVIRSGNDTEVITVKQGCWQQTDEKYCTVGHCVANRPSAKSASNTRYCCCYGNMCNVNISDVYNPSQYSTEDPLFPESRLLSEEYSQYRERTIIISLVSVCSVALIIMGVYLLYRLCLVSHKSSGDSLHLVESPPPKTFDLEGLEIEKLVCRGRNSEVWQGTMGNVNVAIKMFASNHKQLFLNEKYIYSLPFMEHENLLKFYGCDERLTMEGYKQYWIVLSYCPLGNLQCYLKNNTVDWSTFCQMILSIVKGISHLHSEIEKGDQFKPTIAHRDINSRNILVTPENKCIVGDLGFAIATVGSKLMKNGHYESAEQASLQDVGTLRYMAPELLDGAANLRESETSLKQIDIYALGLVMWEMATRCTCLYNGVPVPDYTLPYQKEAGLHPTFEEMQILVSRNKVRPKFSEVWKDYNQAVRSLKDTMEDCWDHDAEARLTAMCVEERIHDMMILWTQDSKHKVPTPLLTTTSNFFTYPTSVSDLSTNELLATPPMISAVPDVDSMRPDASELTDSSTAHLIVTSPPNADVRRDIRNSFSQRGMSVSNSTVETFILTTPSEGETFPKNYNIMLEKNFCVLQPHQGRNPTVERNTHKCSDEELAVSGNTLVYGNETQNLENNFVSLNDNLTDNVNENLDTSLVQSDVLNMNTRPVIHAPIPYLQNQVHRTDVGTRPKNANILKAGSNNNNSNNTEEKKPFFSRLFGSKGFNPLGIFHMGSKSNGKLLNSGNVQSKNSENDSAVVLNERSADVDRQGRNTGPRPNTNGDHPGETSGLRPNQHSAKPSNHNLSEQNKPQNLIVSLQNGKLVNRPSNIMLSNQMRADTSDDSSEPDNPLPFDQVGIAHMEFHGPQQLKLVSNAKCSKSTSDLSPLYRSKEFDEINLNKLRRPDSLKLKSPKYTEKELNVNSSQTYQQKNTKDKRFKIKPRVKTPVIVNHGRFSLYDDRLMCQLVNESPLENNCLKKTSASMNQIKKCCDDNSNSITLSTLKNV